MQKNVVHLVRKFIPTTASFIRNQIYYHKDYSPYVIYTEDYFTVLRDDISRKYPVFKTISSGLYRYVYRYFRLIMRRDAKRLEKYILEIQPEILHLHYGVDALIFSKLIRRLKIPAVVSFYGYDCTSFPKRFFGYGKTLLNKKVFSNPSVKQVFAMSPDMKKDLIRLGCPAEKVSVHYYGTETKPFNIVKEYDYKPTILFLMISGIHKKKGHIFLLEAFEEAAKKSKVEIQLQIVGDGPEKSRLLNKVKEINSKQIHIADSVDYSSETHIDYFKKADVFIHPSITPEDGDKEGIPGAIVEAMAAGLPVVSTYHAGIPYIIENGITGLLVDEYDTYGLSRAIVRIANDRELREQLGKAAKMKAIHDLDIHSKEEELENIYKTL